MVSRRVENNIRDLDWIFMVLSKLYRKTERTFQVFKSVVQNNLTIFTQIQSKSLIQSVKHFYNSFVDAQRNVLASERRSGSQSGPPYASATSCRLIQHSGETNPDLDSTSTRRESWRSNSRTKSGIMEDGQEYFTWCGPLEFEAKTIK